ncbi:GPO family capsid scaffolding protein [Stutzerimonas kunmingensis]|uniref:GPO family capsid scaffolding protein n=1 Tax=Stutzerimonas kunmingensis TaxID=1211807 RepID=UPI001F348DC2|nr:GPO family capsid scaffolding protein [Stutzerimonas kunmingensis]UIP32563.1 GPO family capsid scaffolding protein [Stutzerimonas kunmingensis]
MPRSLVTDWKRVATSGKTADGRTIEAQDLRDMAEAYNPALYTATIWYEHIRYVGSFGTVTELKAEDLEDGKVALFAKLQPNDRLLALNKEAQKLFTSIEIQPEFADTGKAYLAGLAVTDEPASLGTEPLHFSRRADKGNYFANLEPLGELIAAPDTDEAAALSFFTRLFSALGKGGPESPATPKDESTPMDPKTVQAFAAAVDKLGTVATSLETSAATFAAKPTEPEKPAVTEPEAGKDGDKATGITAEQFNSLKTSLDDLTEKFNTALNQGKGKDVPNTTGAADDKQEAVY